MTNDTLIYEYRNGVYSIIVGFSSSYLFKLLNFTSALELDLFIYKGIFKLPKSHECSFMP